MPYFYHAEYINLVWSVYILLAILRRRISGFGTPLLLVQYNIERDHKKPVSTIFIRGNQITQKMCACSLLHLEIYDINSNSRSEGRWKHGEWYRCPTVKSSNTSRNYKIKISHSELICFCRGELIFAVSDSENVNVLNTRVKGNPVKEGSIIFRFERPTSQM